MTNLIPLNEHIITAAKLKLVAGIGAATTEINARDDEGYTLREVPAARIFDYVPPITEIVDFPALGIMELAGGFAEGTDLGSGADGRHAFAVIAYCQAPEQRELVFQLRRLRQAVVTVMLEGRDLEHPAGPSYGAWGLTFDGYRPGSALGRAEGPQIWTSWTSMAFVALSNDNSI